MVLTERAAIARLEYAGHNCHCIGGARYVVTSPGNKRAVVSGADLIKMARRIKWMG